MFSDRVLIADVRQAAKKRSLAQREYFDRRIADYESACLLSRGGDKARSDYWRHRALSVKSELMAIAGRTIREEAVK